MKISHLLRKLFSHIGLLHELGKHGVRAREVCFSAPTVGHPLQFRETEPGSPGRVGGVRQTDK